MSRREKIIVLLTVVAVFYGLFNFFFPERTKKGAPKMLDRNELNRFLTDTIVGIKASELSEMEKKAIKMASYKPYRDPFLFSDTPLSDTIIAKEEVKEIQPDKKIAYTGYLKINNRYLAIVDGIEYEVGEELEGGQFILSEITPEQIVITDKKSRGSFRLPLVESTPSG